MLAPRAQPTTRARALEIASRACATKAEFQDYPGLHYQPTALGQRQKLQYRFAASGCNPESSLVTVDALTAAVQIESALTP